MICGRQGCHPFIALLSEEDKDRFLCQSESLEFEKGEHIIRFMDQNNYLYLINAGSVRVTLFSTEGKEVSFIDIGAGGNFGELSAIDGRPRSANVIALSDVEITIIPPHVFIEILEKYPVACVELLRQLTTIVRRLCDRIYEYSTMNAADRIYLELLRIAKENLDLDGIARINNPPTQAVLANRLSCSREKVSREFKRLEKLGIINRMTGQWIIEDIKQLKERVHLSSS